MFALDSNGKFVATYSKDAEKTYSVMYLGSFVW